MAEEAIQMAPAGTRGDASSLPADVLPLVAVRNVVLFPGTVLPVTMSRPRSPGRAVSTRDLMPPPLPPESLCRAWPRTSPKNGESRAAGAAWNQCSGS